MAETDTVVTRTVRARLLSAQLFERRRDEDLVQFVPTDAGKEAADLIARLQAENEALRRERDEANAEAERLSHVASESFRIGVELQAAREAAEAKAARLKEALEEIRDLRERPYDKFPSDWSEQIAACSECQSYKNHPIQLGICNQHRKPLYARDGHDAHETSILGSRAREIARAALEA